METIRLQTKEALNTYINPQRQNILRRMRIAGEPMTPKQISDRVGISPSSVQHHIRKLLSIGVVALDHTRSVHGITAKYYRIVPKMVQIGSPVPDGSDQQRVAVLQNALASTFAGYSEYYGVRQAAANPAEQFGDMLYGILHLTNEQAREVYGLILSYIQSHELKTAGSSAWEYALIAYPVSGDAE